MDIVAQILRAAAAITENERTNHGYHFPRGTMGTLKHTLAGFEDGRARDGRLKYDNGAVASVLRALADCITPAGQ